MSKVMFGNGAGESTNPWNGREWVLPLSVVEDINKLGIGTLPKGMTTKEAIEYFDIREPVNSWKEFYDALNKVINEKIKDRDIEYDFTKDDTPGMIEFTTAYTKLHPNADADKAHRLYERLMFKDDNEKAVRDIITEANEEEQEDEEELPFSAL